MILHQGVKVRFSILIVFMLLLAGCSSVTLTTSDAKLDKTRVMAVDSFANYTEVPMAGYRAAAMVDAALLNRGYTSKTIYTSPNEEYLKPNAPLSDRLDRARKISADYLMSGEVIEWRYKTGIDGEPAVSLVIRVYDVNTGAIVYSATASKSGFGYSSVGVAAQDVITSMIH